MEDTPRDHSHSCFSISFGSSNLCYFSLLCRVTGHILCGFRFQSSISDLYLIKQYLPSNFAEKQPLRQRGKRLL